MNQDGQNQPQQPPEQIPTQVTPVVAQPPFVHHQENPGQSLGIASLISAFMMPPLGIVLGIIGLQKSNKIGMKNELALIGIIISSIFTFLTIVGVILFIIFGLPAIGTLVETCNDLGSGTHVVNGVTYNCGATIDNDNNQSTTKSSGTTPALITKRDTQRKLDLSRVFSGLTSYESANRGAIPTDWSEFENRYLTSNGDIFIDPSGAGSSNPSATSYVFTAGNVGKLTGSFSSSTQNIIYYNAGYVCYGESIKESSSRKVAMRIYLEAGGDYCLNN
jgi:hypothetical protein